MSAIMNQSSKMIPKKYRICLGIISTPNHRKQTKQQRMRPPRIAHRGSLKTVHQKLIFVWGAQTVADRAVKSYLGIWIKGRHACHIVKHLIHIHVPPNKANYMGLIVLFKFILIFSSNTNEQVLKMRFYLKQRCSSIKTSITILEQ